MVDFDLSTIQASDSGLDDFFKREPEMVTPVKQASRVKIASLADLDGFVRISSDTLIKKSEKDLWSITKDADGSLVIERMFDDSTPVDG